MTQEEKQLLLKDLCARLPYGVMIYFEGWNPEKLSEINLNEDVYNGMGGIPIPYLRPMSSMTDEEIDKMWEIYDSGPVAESSVAITEYLYKRHLDCHYLIEKGLALEAKEGMYKTE
jgi:hypothetical protein